MSIHYGASQKVLEYLRKHPDIVLPYRELEAELDLPNATVGNSVGYLIANRAPITRPMQGTVMYHSGPMPAAPASNKLYEYIGTSGGRIIVKGEDDELYVIRPLFEP